MSQQITEFIKLRSYLLGAWPSEQQRHIEERLITDQKYFNELLMAEDELIDDYLNGSLSTEEREMFERHFLSTAERQQKLRFGKSLSQYIRVASTSNLPATQTRKHPATVLAQVSGRRFFSKPFERQGFMRVFSFAAIALLILFGGWELVKIRILQGQIKQEADRRAQVEQELNRIKQGSESSLTAEPHKLFSFVLTPGATRESGQLKRVIIPAHSNVVQFRLEMVSGNFLSYRVILQQIDDSGKAMLAAEQLLPETTETGEILTVNFPASSLVNGDYQLKLSGVASNSEQKDISRYYFRVIKESHKQN